MYGVGSVYVLGDYWHSGRDVRTEIGQLVHRAKDQADEPAAAELARRFARLADSIAADSIAAEAGPHPLVVPVPCGPQAGRPPSEHLVAVLATALAEGGAGVCRADVLIRRNDAPRLRGTDPARRAEAAARAGYEARAPVAGCHIVLVDDVILTGATLAAAAEPLLEAGAESVTAAVAARTRLHQQHSGPGSKPSV